jgi:hypothetical protein
MSEDPETPVEIVIDGIIPYYVAVLDHNNNVLHVGYQREGFSESNINWKDNDLEATGGITVEDQLIRYFEPFLTETYGDDLEVFDGTDEYVEDRPGAQVSDLLYKTVNADKDTSSGNYIYIIQIFKMTPEWIGN